MQSCDYRPKKCKNDFKKDFFNLINNESLEKLWNL